MAFTWSNDYYVLDLHEPKGLGLFANRPFTKGEAIYPFDYWSLEQMPMHVTNHSCDPNATFVEEMLIALRDIAPHTEITFDYLAHPLPAAPWDFECHCGAAACVGRVRVVRPA